MLESHNGQNLDKLDEHESEKSEYIEPEHLDEALNEFCTNNKNLLEAVTKCPQIGDEKISLKYNF